MNRVILAPVTTEEIAHLYALHYGYCEANPESVDYDTRYQRAMEWARRLPDAPLEILIQDCEAA